MLLEGSFDEAEWYVRELVRLPFEFAVPEPAHMADTMVALDWGLVQRDGRRR